jgi:hypothetical protein
LNFVLKPSRRLAVAIVAAHALAGASVFVVLPGLAGALVAAGLVALGVSAAWTRALLRSPRSVRAIAIAGDVATLELADGARLEARIGERRHVSRLMVTLPFAKPVRRTILITRDMLGGDLFRTLRIWALWGRVPGVAGKQLGA